MKKLIKYLTHGVPTVDDPTGSSPDAPQIPTYIDCFLLESGSVEIQPGYIIQGVEGSSPGQYMKVSGATNAQLQAIKTVIQTLSTDSDVGVATIATAVKAKLTRTDRANVLQSLVSTAQNVGATATRRMFATLLIGLIVEDEL